MCARRGGRKRGLTQQAPDTLHTASRAMVALYTTGDTYTEGRDVSVHVCEERRKEERSYPAGILLTTHCIASYDRLLHGRIYIYRGEKARQTFKSR